MNRLYLNDDWYYTGDFKEKADEKLASGWMNKYEWKAVRLPHSVSETPLHYFDEHEYQMVSGYKRSLDVKEEWRGKTLLLTIDGAAHLSDLYINGVKAGSHACGYTAYTVDISSLVEYGKENEIFIRVDSNESLNIPPFGFVIDYMTYGGIYRDVYLDVKDTSYIKDVFVYAEFNQIYETDGHKEAKESLTTSEIEIVNPQKGMVVKQYLRKRAQKEEIEFASRTISEEDIKEGLLKLTLIGKTGSVALWDVESPALYEIQTVLSTKDNTMDSKEIIFGYRKAEFKADGFYLNHEKIKIFGVNRHQSFPYVGYAMPESMQKHDADLLKKELGLNAVRTSHYPQSHYFLDRCDELGLLVFTEIPGWQHIGDEEWKNQAVQNVEDMVLQYRNHASIILWGVRINESVDDDEFYRRTNEKAHLLDKTRATGGVRCYKKSNLLEDVYTYNDFLHSGDNKGCDKKSAVTTDMSKGYLISEYMGHMYPTKAFDWEEHRLEHAIRHANVLNEVAAQKDIAGSFAWCMFDYNTHKDFGSGDRICYHGVMDMFRNPKLAAAVYASQGEEPVLEISSSMDIGEHPGCNRNETYIFTNADSVRMYKNDYLIKEYTHKDSTHKNMKNPPIRIDDYIGDILEKEEKMSKKQAEDVKAILNEVAKVGLYKMSKKTYLKAGKMMLVYHMKMDDAVQLYNKYIGDWGGESTIYKFEAIKDGKVVKTITKAPMTKADLIVDIDHDVLSERNSYDVAAIRIKSVDENGNLLNYYNDPVEIKVEGNIELIGPNVISLSGGMGGTYIKTIGKTGEGSVKISFLNHRCEKEIKIKIQ